MDLTQGRQQLQRTAVRWGRRHGAPLLVALAVFVICWQQLHRGHAWGDDFALYVRQAKSLIDGNIGQVISDNHFAVDNSPTAFSPYMYPWVWPMILAPFIRLFGVDYDRLKFIVIILFCACLWMFHELVRRRSNRWVAIAAMASMGTTVAYIVHTDHLLSEFPFMLSVFLTLWWLERCTSNGRRLDEAGRRSLVILGLFAVAAFNVRREGLALVPAIMALQAFDVIGRRRRVNWRGALTPYASFIAGVVMFQLLLPSALAPDYERGGLDTVWTKVKGPYKATFIDQLGLGRAFLSGFWFVFLMVLVLAGIGLRLWRATRQDLPWAVFAVACLVIIGSAPNPSLRYLMVVTPFGLYFAIQGIASLPLERLRAPKATAWALAATLTAALAISHLGKVWDRLDQVATQRDRRVDMADGPESTYVQPAWTALERYTHQDDIIAFWKVRAMALYTNRTGVQTISRDVIEQRADYYLMKKGQTAYQYLVSELQGESFGWTVVWQDPSWILWKMPAMNQGVAGG